jgi:gliding motility-associated-like protein
MKKIISILVLLVCIQTITKATHIFGGELTYQHISGNNYRFNLTIYADCAGNPTLLNNLYNALPIIERFNGTSSVDNFNLALVPGSGVEVTPVCPGQAANTTCANPSGGTVVGIREFKFTGTKNLNGTSANWKFVFWGDLNINNNRTGRSSNITNINQSSVCGGTGTSVMAFEATLNNVAGPNNSALFTTIPTPFHCINKPQSYNQGAVDADVTDALSFSLTQGIDGNQQSLPYCFVQYVGAYSYLNPLASAAGTFNFNATTGQLNYTPNVTQNSLVVIKVTETRNGVVVGTTMREMTFVVIPNCNNTPPGGVIGTVSTGFIDSLTNIYVCKNATNLVFTIPALDVDNNNINVTYAGLPTGASLNIANNNTSAPTITGTYPMPAGGYVLGNYTFFVTYEDDGCPLTSKQTVAYTIHVISSPNIATTNTQPTCSNGNVGSINVTATNGTPGYQYTVNNGTFGTNNQFNNLAPGSYTVQIKDAQGCTITSNISLLPPPTPIITNLVKTSASCVPGCDANITITATTPSGTTLTYSSNNGSTYQASNVIGNLCVGTYTIAVKDGVGCSTTSIVSIVNPPAPNITSLTSNPATCVPGCDGTITNIIASSSSGGPYTYSINGGTFQAANSFTGLCVGSYTIAVKDAAGCTATSAVNVGSPPLPIFNAITSVTASCIPGCDGQFTNVSATSAAGGLQYKLNIGGVYQTSGTFNGLCTGSYTIYAKDASGCTKTTVANITTQPNPSINSVTTTKASCIPGCDGTIAVTAAGALGLSINYQINTNPVQIGSGFGGLCVGNYTITVKDTKGCTSTSAATIVKESNPIITTSTGTNITCFGKNDGKITITATGTGAITYALNPGGIVNATGAFNNLTPNTYTVGIVDAKGCTNSAAFNILEPGLLAFNTVTHRDKTCENQNNGAITVTIFGGTNPITYSLNGANNNTNGQFVQLADGNYTVVVTDANNCSIQTQVTILPPLNPLKISTTFKEIPCDGTNLDGWAEVTATAGNPPYSYFWNTIPQQNTPRIENLFAGQFIITVVDAFGCDQVDTVLLRDPSYCCTNLFIPNAFTPNDDLTNDKLIIKTDTKLLNPLLQIYNRFGEKVFETQDITENWTGEYNRQIAELGTYFYVLKYKCAVNNKDYVKKGDFILIK